MMSFVSVRALEIREMEMRKEDLSLKGGLILYVSDGMAAVVKGPEERIIIIHGARYESNTTGGRRKKFDGLLYTF